MPYTRNDLPDNTRKSMAALLNARLTDTLDLKLAVKQAHWNVKGPDFIALHELFDAIAARVDTQADDIAERAVALGAVAHGTSQNIAKNTALAPYPSDLTGGKAHLEALADRISQLGKLVREAINQADEAGDKDTADLFTGQSRALDKDLWFIEAHLQE
ncbi:MAG: DNA starvation/stationary phase protection protein Dps [Caulobacterales bacterium]